jgi:hypothetical protein
MVDSHGYRGVLGDSDCTFDFSMGVSIFRDGVSYHMGLASMAESLPFEELRLPLASNMLALALWKWSFLIA